MKILRKIYDENSGSRDPFLNLSQQQKNPLSIVLKKTVTGRMSVRRVWYL